MSDDGQADLESKPLAERYGSRISAGRILRNRGLRRLLLAFLAFSTAEYATWVAILLFAYERTGPGSVGVVAVLMLVPAALVAPAAAVFGDRRDRRLALIGGYLAYGIGLAATAAMMESEAPILVVYLVAGIGSAALVVVRPTQSALMPALSQTPDDLTSANGAAGVVEGAGMLLGPLLAAAVVSLAGPSAVMAVGAAAALIGALLCVGLRPPTSVAAPSTDQPVPDVHRANRAGARVRVPSAVLVGLRAVLTDPDARLVIGLMSARMMMVGAADVLFVLMALDLLGMGEPGAGILSAALGAGTIAGGAISVLLVGSGRLSSVAAAGACLFGLALGFSAWLASPLVAFAMFVVGGSGLAIVDVAGRTILQRSVRDEVLNRVFGVQEGLAMAALAVGSVLVPVFVNLVGLTGSILITAALLPLIVVLAWSRLVDLEGRTPAPTQAIALLRRTTLFGPLPAPELEAIARRATWATVPAGVAVIREGEGGDRFYILASGVVRVEREGRHLRDLVAGDGFGEIALLRDVPRTATVTATAESVLLTIDRATFLTAITGNPQVAARADAVVAGAAM